MPTPTDAYAYACIGGYRTRASYMQRSTFPGVQWATARVPPVATSVERKPARQSPYNRGWAMSSVALRGPIEIRKRRGTNHSRAARQAGKDAYHQIDGTDVARKISFLSILQVFASALRPLPPGLDAEG